MQQTLCAAIAEPAVVGGIRSVGRENFLVGALEDRFIELLPGRTERGRRDAVFLRQGQVQFLAVVPEIIDSRAVALRVFGTDQTKDQQHEHEGVDDPFAQPPLAIVIGGHILKDVSDLLP